MKGICPKCGRTCALSESKTLRWHTTDGKRDGPRCLGSWGYPTGVKQ